LENFNLEIQNYYRRALRRVDRRLASPAVSIFLVGFLTALSCLAIKKVHTLKGYLSSEEHFRRITIDCFCGALLVYLFCLVAVRAYKIIQEYYLLTKDLKAFLGPQD
jgi:hypothetical protein